MTDYIPFDIQMEIIKKVSDVKSLIRFRSVSKSWKSFIDSSDFIKGYGARHIQPHSFILRYKVDKKFKYTCFVDDDNNETFKVQLQELDPSVVSPLLEQYHVLYIVGACHGLLCLFCYDEFYCPLSEQDMVFIWNPYIRKSFGLAVDPHHGFVFGFRVCPVTRDPTIVKILYEDNMPWHVEVFTLSSGVWNVIPSGNFPGQTVRIDPKTQVVIDRFIYWAAWDYGESTTYYMVVSFDLIAKEFRVVDLPDSLTKECSCCSLSKLRESLVVYGSTNFVGAGRCGVWVMEHDSSFRKLFTIGAPVYNILGFKKNGETIFESRKELGASATLDVYDPCSQQIKNLGISGVVDSFFMGPYKESLLLLNHLDLIVYWDDN